MKTLKTVAIFLFIIISGSACSSMQHSDKHHSSAHQETPVIHVPTKTNQELKIEDIEEVVLFELPKYRDESKKTVTPPKLASQNVSSQENKNVKQTPIKSQKTAKDALKNGAKKIGKVVFDIGAILYSASIILIQVAYN